MCPFIISGQGKTIYDVIIISLGSVSSAWEHKQ
jgi:hypothetical protein